MQNPETKQPELKKPKRYLPTPAECLEQFTVDNSATRKIVQNKNPNACVHKRVFTDITPLRKSTFRKVESHEGSKD